MILISDIMKWLSLVIYLSGRSHFSDSPCCLRADSAARGDAPRPRLGLRSAPVWAGIVSGWWCSSGSSGLGDGGATPWSSPSGSSQFCGGQDAEHVLSNVELQPNKPTWRSVNLPVLKLCCSCFVRASIRQLLRLKKVRFRRKHKKKIQLILQQD